MRKLTLIIFVLLVSIAAEACDICGCGLGGYYIGILPEFHKKIIGLRYRFNALQTHLGAGGSVSYLTTDERYSTAELWGGWTIGKKFRVIAYVPLSFIVKQNQESEVSQRGIGDAGIQGFYQVFSDNAAAGSSMLIHSLWLGVGVKLPTGKYQPSNRSGSRQDANIYQLGTGSWDMTVNAMYDLRIRDAGLNSTLSYKLNSANNSNYQYGNKFSWAAQFYYKFRIKDVLTLAPNIGCAYENGQNDKNGKLTVDASGGSISFASLGTEINFRKIAIGGSWQTPITQDLAKGFVRSQNKAMLHFSVLL